MVARPDAARTDRLPLDNAAAARRLEQAARILEAQDANVYRVRAYRTAAQTVRELEQPAAELLRTGGREALQQLPGIGDRLAVTLEQLLLTGHIPHVEGLGARPEDLLGSVPGIGPETARRIHDTLKIETLEDLERAAHDGRLAKVHGMGPKRLRGVRESLAGRFRRSVGNPGAKLPPAEDVLAVDATYRKRAEAGTLRLIAPRRFNPEGEAWLPVMKTRLRGRKYRVMYSNTAAAHEAGKTRDWVVVYFEEDGATGQCTVVTENRGPLSGKRVVRGREAECARHYLSALFEE
jgi:DNA uptake protein ComE-like DNA-binding protein